jgi:hypothetical protein
MSGLKRTLQQIKDTRLRQGGAVYDRTLAELQAYRKQQLIIFTLLSVLIVSAVAFCAYFLTRFPERSGQVKILAGVIGLGTGGGIEVLRRFWKEWSQTSLLLILIENASEAQITTIIDKLIAKL